MANVNTDEAKDMEDIGRLRKYIIQHVMKKPITSEREAAAQTNELIREIDHDVRGIRNQPHYRGCSEWEPIGFLSQW